MGAVRFLARLPYRGWSWQETNSVPKSAIIRDKGLARNRTILCVKFVSCQLHPLYRHLARYREFPRNWGRDSHPMSRNGTNIRLHGELGLGQGLSGIMGLFTRKMPFRTALSPILAFAQNIAHRPSSIVHRPSPVVHRPSSVTVALDGTDNAAHLTRLNRPRQHSCQFSKHPHK